ncbi:MAG: transposase [Pseudomonadota bacterium]
MSLDETGATTKMNRLHGRSQRGERCRASVTHGHWKKAKLIDGLPLEGLTPPMVVYGAMDGEIVTAYARTILAPTLNEGDTGILDNLPAYKVSGARMAIEAAAYCAVVVKVFGDRLSHQTELCICIEWQVRDALHHR